ncbi:MAG: YdcF family protein [Alphaproteobacteria bacterium]
MSFVLSKLYWVFFSPGNLLVLILILGAFLATSDSKRRQNWGRKICFDVAFLLFFIAIFPVGDWALAPLENRFPPAKPQHVDGILLLGGDEKTSLTEARGEPISFEASSRRYIHFASLARQYPNAKLVYVGGSGLLTPDAKIKEVDVAVAALGKLGVPKERILVEDKSRNTRENARNAFTVLKPEANQTWLLVTSAWHMPRSMAAFQKAGWSILPSPTGYLTSGTFSWKLDFSLVDHLNKLTIAAHEYYGLLAYRLLGYTDTLWPR